MQIATYKDAQLLKKILDRLNVKVKSETFDMKTSGIYIPRWLGYDKIPHHWEPATETAQWYFFLRFHKYKDINVGKALAFMETHGMEKLARNIKRETGF